MSQAAPASPPAPPLPDAPLAPAAAPVPELPDAPPVAPPLPDAPPVAPLPDAPPVAPPLDPPDPETAPVAPVPASCLEKLRSSSPPHPLIPSSGTPNKISFKQSIVTPLLPGLCPDQKYIQRANANQRDPLEGADPSTFREPGSAPAAGLGRPHRCGRRNRYMRPAGSFCFCHRNPLVRARVDSPPNAHTARGCDVLSDGTCERCATSSIRWRNDDLV